MNLQELDTLWMGQNLDKNSIKFLCRKYGPVLILDWIQRGLTVAKKQDMILWHQLKLKELGVEVLQKPTEVKDGKFFIEDAGDYFSESG